MKEWRKWYVAWVIKVHLTTIGSSRLFFTLLFLFRVFFTKKWWYEMHGATVKRKLLSNILLKFIHFDKISHDLYTYIFYHTTWLIGRIDWTKPRCVPMQKNRNIHGLGKFLPEKKKKYLHAVTRKNELIELQTCRIRKRQKSMLLWERKWVEEERRKNAKIISTIFLSISLGQIWWTHTVLYCSLGKNGDVLEERASIIHLIWVMYGNE